MHGDFFFETISVSERNSYTMFRICLIFTQTSNFKKIGISKIKYRRSVCSPDPFSVIENSKKNSLLRNLSSFIDQTNIHICEVKGELEQNLVFLATKPPL